MSVAFEESPVNIRIKLLALWTAVTFFYIYGDYFELYIPGKTAGLISGDNVLNTPTTLFAASLLLALPPLVIIITALAKATTARAVSISMGVLFTAVTVLVGATSFAPERAAYLFYAVAESIITIFIVWQAWKWPGKSQK
jgi:hypothetical protein